MGPKPKKEDKAIERGCPTDLYGGLGFRICLLFADSGLGAPPKLRRWDVHHRYVNSAGHANPEALDPK